MLYLEAGGASLPESEWTVGLSDMRAVEYTAFR